MPTVTTAAPPARTAAFRSSSGNTAILYYTSKGRTGASSFRGPLRVPRGYDRADAFLCGFTYSTRGAVDRLAAVHASVNAYAYDSRAGVLDLGVSAGLKTQQQPWAYELALVVVLTRGGVASFDPVGGSASGSGSCTIARTLPAAIPAGKQYIGLATRSFQLGTRRIAIPLNVLGFAVDSLTLAAPSASLVYRGALSDASGTTPMYLEWNAAAAAFDPAEMAQNSSPLFPQYTVLGTNVPTRQAWTEHDVSAVPLTGVLNALEGAAFMYGPGKQSELWRLEASVSHVQVSGPVNAETDMGIFLGTTFGDPVNTSPFTYQESRAVGFLR